MNFYRVLRPFKVSIRLLRNALFLFTLPQTMKPRAASQKLSVPGALLPPICWTLVSTREIPGAGGEELCQQSPRHSVPDSSQRPAGGFSYSPC